MTRSQVPLRAILAVGIAAVLPLWGAYSFYETQTAHPALPADPYQVEALSVRLEAVRQIVPEDAVMGFITDAPPTSDMFQTWYYVTQYALAPRLLERGPDRAWVLAMFANPYALRETAARYRLTLNRFLGPNIALLQNEAR
ncbi:MAG TPA: hypothetical protein VE959_11090 [Bryobacteraceae bacterium]|nr:hypothetical protein [Bryobacteraceae bacterium]